MADPKESKKHHRRRQVFWGDVEIYEFPNVLGDNPAANDGAPLTIGWKHTTKETLDIGYYEYKRLNVVPRRRRKELLISGPARDAYLLGEGYKLDDLLRVADETNMIRASRRASMKGTKWERFKKVLDNSSWFGTRILPKDQANVTPKIIVSKSA